MSTFRKYPEIVRLDKRPEILSVKHVVATEKVHGTNFRVLPRVPEIWRGEPAPCGRHGLSYFSLPL